MKQVMKWVVGPILLVGAATVLAVQLGRRSIDRLVRDDVRRLLDQPGETGRVVVTDRMLEDLPEPVQRYLRYTGVIGKPIPRTVYLRQSGSMHMAADAPWIPIEAEQYYSVQPPGFVWDGTMHAGPVPLARGRDRYINRSGNMLIKAGLLVPVVDASGPEMDQGALMRYLSEIIWFPAAFLAGNVSFEPLDDRSARVTLSDNGQAVAGTMYFDDDGRLTGFGAQRYRMVDGGYRYDLWWTPVLEYGEFEGLKLPVRAKADWKLPEGDLEYIAITITELSYDPA